MKDIAYDSLKTSHKTTHKIIKDITGTNSPESHIHNTDDFKDVDWYSIPSQSTNLTSVSVTIIKFITYMNV